MNRQFFISLIFTILFLYLALHKVDINEVIVTLNSGHYIYLLPSLAVILFTLWIKGIRWRYILSPVKDVPVSTTISITSIGLMLNNILPARLGELGRAYILKKNEHISKSASIGTIAIERVLDGLSLLLLILIVLPFIPKAMPPWLQFAMYSSFAVYLGALVALLIMLTKRELFEKCLLFVFRPLPEKYRNLTISKAQYFVDGLSVLRQKRILVSSFALSVLIWAAEGLLVYTSLLTLNIDIGVGAAIFLMSSICLSTMIPSAPGYVGTIQLACVVVLTWLGIAKPIALSYSIVFQFLSFFPDTILGALFLVKDGLSLKELKSASESRS